MLHIFKVTFIDILKKWLLFIAMFSNIAFYFSKHCMMHVVIYLV